MKPKEKKPYKEFLQLQGRFKHMSKNDELINEIEVEIERRWNRLMKLCGEETAQ